jgi:hypothetical protein
MCYLLLLILSFPSFSCFTTYLAELIFLLSSSLLTLSSSFYLFHSLQLTLTHSNLLPLFSPFHIPLLPFPPPLRACTHMMLHIGFHHHMFPLATCFYALLYVVLWYSFLLNVPSIGSCCHTLLHIAVCCCTFTAHCRTLQHVTAHCHILLPAN